MTVPTVPPPPLAVDEMTILLPLFTMVTEPSTFVSDRNIGTGAFDELISDTPPPVFVTLNSDAAPCTSKQSKQTLTISKSRFFIGK